MFPERRFIWPLVGYNAAVKLSRTVLGVTCENPLVLAACPLGLYAKDFLECAEAGAGLAGTKSCWLKPHKGHPEPTIVASEHWTINAVGLAQGGYEDAAKEVTAYRAATRVPLIINIVAESIHAFEETAARYVALQPDFLEVNISCPNVESEFGKPFASNPEDAAAVTRAVKAASGGVPVFMKLSPNVESIGAIARACADAGADGLTAVNTFGPGLAIDPATRLPMLSNRTGGVSGPGIKPLALKCVADVYAATEGTLPIIGLGGVETGRDAAEMLLAGASLVGIATAAYTGGPAVFGRVRDELRAWCEQEGVKDVADLTGAMHKELAKRGAPWKA
jgi:dihydroorotate dehydrogenase (NAD+) catalytic subunit